MLPGPNSGSSRHSSRDGSKATSSGQGANFNDNFSPPGQNSRSSGPSVPLLAIPNNGDSKVNHLELVLSCVSFQILWGLAYLHYEHNVHRDIKPGM